MRSNLPLPVNGSASSTTTAEGTMCAGRHAAAWSRSAAGRSGSASSPTTYATNRTAPGASSRTTTAACDTRGSAARTASTSPGTRGSSPGRRYGRRISAHHPSSNERDPRSGTSARRGHEDTPRTVPPSVQDDRHNRAPHPHRRHISPPPHPPEPTAGSDPKHRSADPEQAGRSGCHDPTRSPPATTACTSRAPSSP